MAFTNNPIYSTYSSKKIQLMHDLDLAPAGTDISSIIGGAVNVLPFKGDKGEIYGETRYSIQAESITFGFDANHTGQHVPSTHAIVRGMYVQEYDIGKFNYFVVIDDDVGSRVFCKQYPDPVILGLPFGWASVTNVTDNSELLHTKAQTPVRFVEYITSTNTLELIMSDGVDLYSVTNGGLIRCTDPDMPTPHVAFPVSLDGYIFLAKGNTPGLGYADIYNSDLNDPMSWTAGNFLSAEMYPDTIKALLRINNYIMAIGNDSCEYFYDAGSAVGSPLSRYESAALPFGCEFPNTIAYLEDTVMMLSHQGKGEDCFVLIKGFKAQIIDAKPVLQILQYQLQNGITDHTKLRAGFFRQEGKLFYFIQFDGTQTDAGWTTECFVYSTECDMWTRMRSDMYNGSSTTPGSGLYGWPVLFTSNSTSKFPYTFFAGQFSNTGKVVFGHLDPTIKYDQFDPFNQYNIYQEINVPQWNDDTLNKKTMIRVHVNYQVRNDLDVTTSALGFVLNFSDDQGVTWTSSFPLGGKGNQFPFFQQLGTFRERMFKLINFSTRMRYYNLEVDINKGIR